MWIKAKCENCVKIGSTTAIKIQPLKRKCAEPLLDDGQSNEQMANQNRCFMKAHFQEERGHVDIGRLLSEIVSCE